MSNEIDRFRIKMTINVDEWEFQIPRDLEVRVNEQLEDYESTDNEVLEGLMNANRGNY